MKFIPRLLLAIWRAWDLQIFILISLILQVILIFLASFRKHNTTIWLRAILWLAYLLADPVAILALGILAHSDKSVDHSHNKDLLAFWAPFLLLHLGGPDTITALALEDNELWLRHLLNLVFQVGIASYVFVGTLPKTRLLVPAIFMFLAGILKYAERTVALWSASMNRMRNTMITKHVHADFDYMPPISLKHTQIKNLEEEMLILKAYKLMQAFMPLFADLTISVQERKESMSFFVKRSPVQAFKVIDAELAFLYERLYTKSAVIETVAGCVLRLITLSSILTSLILFILTKKDGYLGVDTVITNILLAGALALECYSVGLLIFSEWAFIQLKEYLHCLSKLIFTIISFFQLPRKSRLCNSMSKCNLISFCLKDCKPTRFKSALEYVGWKESWDKFRHRGRDIISDEMKEFLFDDIKSKSLSTDIFSEQHFSAYQGQKALQNSGLSDQFKWSIEVNFHHRIILWHIATDICYHADPNKNINALMISKQLSDYMLHLLIMKPFMLTAGIGQIIYGDACDWLKGIFRRGDVNNVSEYEARERLQDEVIQSPCPSVLSDGCYLARELQGLENRKWDVISGVWVEMLCFAAAHCRGMYHAKGLSAGGEFLTFIWLIMNHISPAEIDKQFRAEEGEVERRQKKLRAEREEKFRVEQLRAKWREKLRA